MFFVLGVSRSAATTPTHIHLHTYTHLRGSMTSDLGFFCSIVEVGLACADRPENKEEQLDSLSDCSESRVGLSKAEDKPKKGR